MKKIFIIILVAISFVFFSCKKETVSPKQENNPQVYASTAVTGKINPATDVFTTCFPWGVSSFADNGVNQSATYAGLNLIFCPDKTFTIANDLLAESGHWMFVVNPDNTVLLNLTFDSPDITVESWRSLADVWKVIKLETTAMMLQSTTIEAKTMGLQKLAR